MKNIGRSDASYCCVERGIYQKLTQKEKSFDLMIHRYVDILNEASDAAEKELVNPMILLEISEGEKEKMKRLQNCFRMIRETLEELEE